MKSKFAGFLLVSTLVMCGMFLVSVLMGGLGDGALAGQAVSKGKSSIGTGITTAKISSELKSELLGITANQDPVISYVLAENLLNSYEFTDLEIMDIENTLQQGLNLMQENMPNEYDQLGNNIVNMMDALQSIAMQSGGGLVEVDDDRYGSWIFFETEEGVTGHNPETGDTIYFGQGGSIFSGMDSLGKRLPDGVLGQIGRSIWDKYQEAKEKKEEKKKNSGDDKKGEDIIAEKDRFVSIESLIQIDNQLTTEELIIFSYINQYADNYLEVRVNR